MWGASYGPNPSTRFAWDLKGLEWVPGAGDALGNRECSALPTHTGTNVHTRDSREDALESVFVRVLWTEEALVDQPGVTLWIAALDVPDRDERLHLGSIKAVEGAFLPPHRATFYESVDQRLEELRVAEGLRDQILATLEQHVERPTRREVLAFEDRVEARLRS